MKNLSSFTCRVLPAIAVILIASPSRAEVPQDMRKDFTTARNHVSMKWNPSGYWASTPGAFRGSGSSKEVCAAYTETEVARGMIPGGYTFSVSETRQFVVSNGPVGRQLPAQPAPVANTPPPVTAAGVPVPPPDSTNVPVRRAAIVDDSPASSPPVSVVGARESVMDPVHARPPVAASAPAPGLNVPPPPIPPPPSMPPINGIPGDLQKSYLSRHGSVFMVFDREAGKWKSSEGAIKDADAAEAWCKDATEIDRRANRIPESFSYKHVGKGQVEASRD